MSHTLLVAPALPTSHLVSIVRARRALDLRERRVDPADHPPGALPLLLQGEEEVARGVDAVLEALGEPPSPFADTARGLIRDARAAGFAEGDDPETYAEAFRAVFRQIDDLEARLERARFLEGGPAPTLADWWVFTALVRFDPVYYGLYKCNGRRIQDSPTLLGYLRDLYQHDGVAETVDMDAIKAHHYTEEERINPRLLIPAGDGPDLSLSHDRDWRFDADATRRRGVEEDPDAQRDEGEFVRGRSQHRDVITADGRSGFRAEPGRYHLYVANNCPWCHRTTLTRAMKGLEDVISMDVLYYRRDPERGWQFKPEAPGFSGDSVNGVRYITELYERVGSSEKSVPLLWDRHTETIVNNESAEIIRMMNRAFDACAERPELDLVPPELEAAIDHLNAWIYQDINNGAYKAGFARSQEAYERAFRAFFDALDRLSRILSERRFLCGERFTEADLRLFPTLFRFDAIYYTRFRLNQRMVRDDPHLSRWLHDVWGLPGVQRASNLEHARQGYFGRNANNIVPLGPFDRLDTP